MSNISGQRQIFKMSKSPINIRRQILPACIASIVIPVRDEAAHLEKTLESFAQQFNLSGEILNTDLFEIIVLTNNCSDNSHDIVRKFQAENKFLNLHIADIRTSKVNATSGFIRGLLMRTAFERLISNNKGGGIILTTDGDTQIAEDWIAENISEIESGADAVGGRILFNAEELAKLNPAARKFHLIDEEYRLLSAELEAFLDFLPHDASPRHHQHFNGSFAVTTGTYKKAGGVPEVRFLEDVAFYQSLMRIDAKFRHSPLVKVYTSARETGRTEAGLSTQINDWINLGKNGADFLVESAETLEKRFALHGGLRSVWKNLQSGFEPKIAEIKTLAGFFNVYFKDLQRDLLNAQTFGLLLENLYRRQSEIKSSAKIISLVPVEKAVCDLKKIIENYRREKFFTASAPGEKSRKPNINEGVV